MPRLLNDPVVVNGAEKLIELHRQLEQGEHTPVEESILKDQIRGWGRGIAEHILSYTAIVGKQNVKQGATDEELKEVIKRMV